MKTLKEFLLDEASPKKWTAPKLMAVVNWLADDISKDKSGAFIFRKGFFYTHGGTPEKFAKTITDKLTAVNIDHEVIDKGEVNKPFKGGAKVSAQSHWYVKIQIKEFLTTESIGLRFVTPYDPNEMIFHNGAYAVEASALRLAPGYWPALIKFTKKVGNDLSFELTSEKVDKGGSRIYTQSGTRIKLTVWNDHRRRGWME